MQPGTRTGTAQKDRKRFLNVRPGRVIRRKLAGGETHRYGIRLLSGQFVHVVVDQRGVDVILTLSGPDGDRLAEMDRWSYMRGLESISLVAKVSGIYSLVVRASRRNAPPGYYELKIVELRSSLPKDADLVAAERAYEEGDELSNQGTQEAERNAITKLEEALRLWRVTGDDLFEATTLLYIGVDYFNLGEMRKALDYYSQALPIWHIVGDSGGEAATRSDMGRVYDLFGEPEGALQCYQSALSLAHGARERDLEAEILHHLGMAYFSLGETPQALDYYGRALKLAESLRDRTWQGHIMHHIGEIYALADDMKTALRYLRPALAVSHAARDELGEATALNHIATVHKSMGENRKALENYGKALKLRRHLGYRLGEAQTLANIAAVYESLGRTEKATELYNQAESIFEALGDSRDEAATLYGIAKIARNRGSLPEALARIEAALEIIESLRTKILSEDFRASYFASVAQYYEFCIDLLMQMHHLDPTGGYDAKALEANERARGRALLETLIEGRTDIRRGIDPSLLERERVLRQALDAKNDRQIRLLSSKHSEEAAAAIKKDIEELWAQYQEVEGQIQTTYVRYNALMAPQPLVLKDIQRNLLDRESSPSRLQSFDRAQPTYERRDSAS